MVFRGMRRIPIRNGNKSGAEGQDPRADDPSAAEESVSAVEDARPEVGSEQERADAGAQEVDWQAVALQLRADMDNYRKRQARLAQEQAEREKDQLLGEFLGVVDDLEKILAHIDAADPYYRGIQVTYDGMMKLLRSQGVEAMAAEGTPFDTQWHDAVATRPALPGQDADMLVAEVVQPGYMRGERVLRPARVVVARK